MDEIVYKYRSVPRLRTLVYSRLLAHTLEFMHGSHPSNHSADLELLGYNPEDFITRKFLTMLQILWKEPIVSYLTTEESAATKQLTLIYPTAAAL